MLYHQAPPRPRTPILGAALRDETGGHRSDFLPGDWPYCERDTPSRGGRGTGVLDCPRAKAMDSLQLLHCPDPRSSPQKQNNCSLNPQKSGTAASGRRMRKTLQGTGTSHPHPQDHLLAEHTKTQVGTGSRNPGTPPPSRQVPRVEMNQPAGVHALSLVVQESHSEGAPLRTQILPQNRGAEGREQEYEGGRERRARERE